MTDSVENTTSQDIASPDLNNDAPGSATDNSTSNVDHAEVISSLEKRLNGQSGIISRMERAISSLTNELAESKKSASPEASEKSGDKSSEFEKAKQEIDRMRAELEAKEQATREKTKKHLVIAELQTKGLDAIAAEEAYISMTAHEGKNLKLNDDESAVSYVKGEFDNPMPISDFVTEFLGSDRGRLYAPRRNNPSSTGRANGTDGGNSRYITSAELKSLSPKELQSGNYILKE